MIIADLKDISFYGVNSKYEAQLLILEPSYYFKLSLDIGIKGEDGGHYFNVDICNVGFIKGCKIMMGSKCFIVDDDIDDFDEIEKEITMFVNSIYGNNWDDILVQLRRYFDWEYENHKFVD